MRHHRARVAGVCPYPETAWCRLAALAPRSETLFVHSTAGLPVNSHLVGVGTQPGAGRVAGVVAVVPVPVPVPGRVTYYKNSDRRASRLRVAADNGDEKIFSQEAYEYASW